MELSALESWQYFWPEVALAATALIVAAIGQLHRLDHGGLGELAILGTAVSVFLAARLAGWGEVWIFDRAFVVDGFAVFFKIFIGLATVAVLWILLESARFAGEGEADACARVLVGALALDLMASAASLWMGYAAVEIASLSLWRLLHESEPAAGSFPGGLAGMVVSLSMLGAVAWIAGFCGSADYELVHRAVFELAPQNEIFVALAATAILVAFPTRVWLATASSEARDEPSLDVFVTVAFSAAGVALSVRLLFGVLSEPGVAGRWARAAGLDWSWMLVASAVAAMTIGNLGALRERSLPRLLVATSMAHLGYAMLGLALASDRGLEATLFYLAAFSVASLGAFHLAALIARASGSDHLDACRGLLRGRGTMAGLSLMVFLLSLAGMPSLVGFFAKLHVFTAAISVGLGGVMLLAFASCLLSLVAYGRILFVMGMEQGTMPTLRMSSYDACLTLSLATAVIAFGFYETPLRDLTARSIRLLPR
ncbi:MAG TPA: proton-conducting transporter membrane subunit [Candidatus Binatia bacterium]|nr:proton-conducting transporter membrane subunit [Candidatus Binatia bacterium]